MAKTMIGIVASDKPDKTVVVSVQTRKTHPVYKKQYSETRRFMVHDEKNEARVGDKVAFREIRPISARKRYRLTAIVEKAPIRYEETPEFVLQEKEETA